MSIYNGILNLNSDKEERALFEAIKNESLIIFYGAGISSIAGCKSWRELVDSIISVFPIAILPEQDKHILRELNDTEPKKVISICHELSKQHKCEDKYFEEIIKAVTPNATKESQFIAIHKKLFEIGAISYVTTNIDQGIEKIGGLDPKSKKYFNLTNEKEITDEIKEQSYETILRNGNHFYLHGTIKEIKNTIFSQDSYYEYYNKRYFKQFMETVFKRGYTVLFIGYGLNEYEILQNLFDFSQQSGEKNNYKHYSLIPVFSKDMPKFNLEKLYLEMHSIRAIPYSIDDIGYDKLNLVLDELVNVSKRIKPSVFDIKEEIDKI